jgi:hypothetical protein
MQARQRLLVLPLIALFAGCTSSSEPNEQLRYQHLGCAEIVQQVDAASKKIAELQSRRPTDDEKTEAYLAGIGRGNSGVFSSIGNGSLAVQKLKEKTARPIAELRDELAALQSVATAKQCSPG